MRCVFCAIAIHLLNTRHSGVIQISALRGRIQQLFSARGKNSPLRHRGHGGFSAGCGRFQTINRRSRRAQSLPGTRFGSFLRALCVLLFKNLGVLRQFELLLAQRGDKSGVPRAKLLGRTDLAKYQIADQRRTGRTGPGEMGGPGSRPRIASGHVFIGPDDD